MGLVDPYSLCPCGSGEKFKWCCHKVEAFADRSHKLFEGGQYEQAISVLDEGLKKEPGNAWLLTRKAIVLTKIGRGTEAKNTVRLVLDRKPKHLGALLLMTRLVLETEGPPAGAAQLQQALSAFPAASRRGLVGLVKVVGAFLSEAGDIPAALRHLRLALDLGSNEPDSTVTSTLRVIMSNPTISPWLKSDDELSPVPEALADEARHRFEEALDWAEEGLWSSAAAAFDTLSDDPVAGLPATRNAGFCRLWIADDAGAVAAFRSYIARVGKTAEAVDLEALCQQVAPEPPDDLVEHVQLTWPLRDRDRLLETLKADANVHFEDQIPIDAEQENGPLYDAFALLDRRDITRDLASELPDGGASVTLEQIPLIEGRVYVGSDTAILETYDDGRLDRLQERFTSLAGSTLAPAHPRTKILEKVVRHRLALAWEWLLPDGLDRVNSERLERLNGERLIREIWPRTSMPFLRNRSPLAAAQAGDAEVPLRAALLILEHSREAWTEGFDFAAFRQRFHVPEEPAIDPETVDVRTLHLSRLGQVPADRLTDEKLVAFYRRARGSMQPKAIENAARALVERSKPFEDGLVDSLSVYSDLAHAHARRDEPEEAQRWVERGRQSDPPAKRIRNAPAWDMMGIRIRAASVPPALWVPELAVVIERYQDSPESTQIVMVNLVDMGLLEMVPSPDRPGEILIDPRPLQMLLAEYGPRVTTASGRLGVSAAKPEIWTPGAAQGGGSSGGIWTPGSTPSGPGGGEKKLIIPGR